MKPYGLFLAFCSLVCCSCTGERHGIAFQEKERPPPSMLCASGRSIVDEQGRIVRLAGCNAGSWLLIEPWMINADGQPDIETEKDLWDVLGSRFGDKTKSDLIRTYRKSFFTREDVQRMSDTGMNCLRIPIGWRAVSDPHYGGDLTYLDDCLRWCREFGVYAIIDLHGAPGAQSSNSVIIGERSQNELWKEESFRDATVSWWTNIAARYRNESAVAGYDLLNEAMDAPMNDLIAFYDRLYNAIRRVDPRHILIIEDGLHGIYRLPHPDRMGWSNVVYSFHYYPQSPGETLEAEGRHFPKFNNAAVFFGVPMLVGEFNTMLLERGGVDYFKRFAEVLDYYGWAWTFWTYKKTEKNRNYNWGLYGKSDRSVTPDFHNESAETIRSWIQSLGTENLSVDPLLLTALRQLPADASATGPMLPPLPTQAIPLSLKNAFVMPAEEGRNLKLEWSACEPNTGYWGSKDRIGWVVDIPEPGLYELHAEVAGTADVNLIGIWIDGVLSKESSASPPSGSWTSYKPLALGAFALSTGRHIVEITQQDKEPSFINIRRGWLQPEPKTADQPLETAIRLSALNLAPLPPNSPLCIEWLFTPTPIGYWPSGEKASWSITLQAGGEYNAQLVYATPNAASTVTLLIDSHPVQHCTVRGTGDWHSYTTFSLGGLNLGAGTHTVSLMWADDNPMGCGNLLEILLQKIGSTSHLAAETSSNITSSM